MRGPLPRPPAGSRRVSILDALPRQRLAQLPTPLEEASRLSAALGGPRIFFKRDDLTGFALGGNKVRKLEFLLGRALSEGANALVVCGGFQSNLARIAAAMGTRLGLKVALVLGGEPGEPRAVRGNLLLDHLYGASVHLVETVPRWEFGTAVEAAAQQLRQEGFRPFIVPLGGSGPEGMASYVHATLELLGQLPRHQVQPTRLYVAVGSGGTFCGLLLGALRHRAPYQVIGISVSRPQAYLLEQLPPAAQQAALQIGLDERPQSADMCIDDGYIGPGYGVVTPGCREALALVARTEGVLLDPVYSGKAMHALIDHIRSGQVTAAETVVFLHTGGWPALFAYDPQELGELQVSP